MEFQNAYRTSRQPLYRTALGLITLAGMIVLLAGCGSDSNNNVPQTRLRILNALVGTSPNIDVQVAGQTRFFNIPYGGISTNVTLNAGNGVPVNALQAGSSTSIVSNAGVTLQQSVDELLLVSGVIGTNAGTTGVQINALSPIDLSTPPTNGQVRFYFINAAPFATTADFSYAVNGGASQTNANMTGVSYLQMTPAQLPTFGSTVFTAQVGAETVTSSAFTTTGTKTYIILLTGRPQTAGGNPNLGLQILPVN